MAKSNKIPKSILGVKIPKKLRKASIVRAAVSSPVGRMVLAEALVAAAAAAAAALAKHHPSREQLERAGDKALDTTHIVASSASHNLGAAVGTIGQVVAEIADAATGTRQKAGGKDHDRRH